MVGRIDLTATDGRAAIEVIRRSTFDIVLMDCQMPELDGLSATRQIRARELAEGSLPLPIVAVTANAFAEDRANCLAAGMNDYISKPFTEDQLRAVLVKWAPKAVAVTQEGAMAVTPSTVMRSASDADLSCLDLTTIERLQKTSPNLLARLVETYCNYAVPAVDALQAAVRVADAEAACTSAHSLKSSSANVGALKLSELCRSLEADIKAGGGWDDDVIAKAATAISEELARVLAAFADIKAGLAPVVPSARRKVS